jgi:hypothetical protein
LERSLKDGSLDGRGAMIENSVWQGTGGFSTTLNHCVLIARGIMRDEQRNEDGVSVPYEAVYTVIGNPAERSTLAVRVTNKVDESVTKDEILVHGQPASEDEFNHLLIVD